MAADTNREAVLPGKGVLCATFARNVFTFLARTAEVPIAYVGQHSPDTLVEEYCDMIPLEVVCRFHAAPDSSYVQRYPDFALSHNGEFLNPVVEFFVNTPDQKLGGRLLPCRNPFVDYEPMSETGSFKLYRPDQRLKGQASYRSVTADEFGITREEWHRIAGYAREGGCGIHAAIKSVGLSLWDVTFRFGRTKNGAIVTADWIDQDSCRIVFVGESEITEMGKQCFRHDMPLELILARYQRLADLSEHFAAL